MVAHKNVTHTNTNFTLIEKYFLNLIVKIQSKSKVDTLICYSGAIQYIPFYGGAKGQYLEVKKDTEGSVLSEKVVAEESISSDNIVKVKDENLQSKLLAANLLSLKTLSTNLIKLQKIGSKTGHLNIQEKARFRSQLTSLGETASNTIKLVDEIGEDIDALFKKSPKLLRKYEDDDEDVSNYFKDKYFNKRTSQPKLK